MSDADANPRDADRPAAASRRRHLPKRWVAAVLVLVVLTAGWFAFTSTLSLGANAARADIEDRLRELTGQPVFVDGSTRFELMPRPRLVMNNVRIGGTEPGLAFAVDQIQAQLDLGDALVGRTDIGRLTLVRPELFDADPPSPPSEPEVRNSSVQPGEAQERTRSYDAALTYLRSFFSRFEGVRVVELRDGVFRPDDGTLGFSNANLMLTWPSRGEPARVTGTFVWNGQPTTIELWGQAPLEFLDGRQTGLRVVLDAPPLSLSFDGLGQGGPQAAFSGEVAVSAPSIPRAARWLGRSGHDWPDFGLASLRAQLVLDGDRLAFRDSDVMLGGQSGKGALEAVLASGHPPRLAGTIAFDSLDINQFSQAIAPMPHHAFDVARPLSVSFLEDLDLDLRVSAARASWAQMSVRQFAATLLIADGVGTLDLGDAEVLNGRAQGRLRVDLNTPNRTASGEFSLSGVDAGLLAAQMGIYAGGLSGRADLEARLSAPATNWAEIWRENETDFSLRIAEGTVAKLPLRSMESETAEILPAAIANGSVRFQRLAAHVQSRGPYATISDLQVETDRGKVVANGFLALRDKGLRMTGVFEGTGSPDTENPSVNIPFTTSQGIGFTLKGQWPEPTLELSSAAGPI